MALCECGPTVPSTAQGENHRDPRSLKIGIDDVGIDWDSILLLLSYVAWLDIGSEWRGRGK